MLFRSDPGDDAERTEEALREVTLNLARVYRSTGRVLEALPLLDALVAADPTSARYATWVVQMNLEAGRLERAREALTPLLAEASVHPTLHALEGRLLLAENRPEEALAVFDTLRQDAQNQPELVLDTGEAYLRMHLWDDALSTFRHMLTIDPDSARAHHGAAKASIGLKAYAQAAESALAAVGRLYYYPEAHFHLGVAMARLGWMDRAEQAFQVCVTQRPGFLPAHRWLGKIYRDYLRDPERSAHHLARAGVAPDSAA